MIKLKNFSSQQGIFFGHTFSVNTRRHPFADQNTGNAEILIEKLENSRAIKFNIFLSNGAINATASTENSEMRNFYPVIYIRAFFNKKYVQSWKN